MSRIIALNKKFFADLKKFNNLHRKFINLF